MSNEYIYVICIDISLAPLLSTQKPLLSTPSTLAYPRTAQYVKAAGVLKGQEGLLGAMEDHPGPGLRVAAGFGLMEGDNYKRLGMNRLQGSRVG